MTRTKVSVVLGVVAAAATAFAVASCGDSTSPTVTTYSATLSPANEVPPKTTTGTGVATFVDRGTKIDWTLQLTGMSNVVLSHIHGPAPAGTNANVMINLFIPNTATGTVSPIVATGSITDANNVNVSLDSLRTLFNNGNAYVNVHTSANPAGEIRGQVARQ